MDSRKSAGKDKIVMSTQGMRRRMLYLGIFFAAICFVGLIARLYSIQIVQHEKYRGKAAAQQLSDTVVTPNRGVIYDANMKVLAKSATVWTIFVSPIEVGSEEDAAKIASGLSQILGVDEAVIAEKLTKKTSYFEVIKYKVEKPTADAVRLFASDNELDGIFLAQDSKRYYPFGDFAAQVLGFTGTDNQGLSGLEAYYDKTLTGLPGRVVSAKNAWGFDMDYEYEALYEAQDGMSLVLTIDEIVQHYLEKNLEIAVKEHDAKSGMGIVMDVKTGAILAMATAPDYDPNQPFAIADEKVAAAVEKLSGDARKEELLKAQQQQWRNRAISDLYEPGSVFKIVTASAALDSGKLSLKSTFYCPGHITIAGTTMRCANTAGHGAQNFAQALTNSCNPAFITIGQTLGKQVFSSYYEAFGLTQKTGIDLPAEAQSQFYSAERMGPVELASTSFGQSQKITPLQMISAVSAAVNGGYVLKPYVVSKVLDPSGNIVQTFEPEVKRQAISNETSQIIASIMEDTVAFGPGSNAYVMGYRIGGKSGTSQKLDANNPDARLASFVAIAPAEDPRIAILIIIDEPNSYSTYGGVLCAPVAGSVMAEVLPYIGVEPIYSDAELQKAEVQTPNTVEMNLLNAQVKLQQRGFNYKVIGDGATVHSQFPSSGLLPKGSTIILYTSANAAKRYVTMPDVVGKNAANAVAVLQNAGLNTKLVGSAASGASIVVVSQNVTKGTEIEMGTVVTVELRDSNLVD